MGSDLCNCNFVDNEEKKEENVSSYIQNQQLSILSGKKILKNTKHIFYLKSLLLLINYLLYFVIVHLLYHV